MSMYEIGKFMVCKFTVHGMVYCKLLLLTSHWPISKLLHFHTVDSLFFNQPVSYYNFLHHLHVQEKHYLAFITLMELNYGLRNMISM